MSYTREEMLAFDELCGLVEDGLAGVPEREIPSDRILDLDGCTRVRAHLRDGSVLWQIKQDDICAGFTRYVTGIATGADA